MSRTLAFAAVVVLAACETGSKPTDGGRPNPIIDGMFVCVAPDAVACLDNVHHSCAPDGEFLSIVRVDCDTVELGDPPRRSVCVDELGCALCRPNEAFCDGANVVQCNAEGAAFDVVEVCDIEAGFVCQQGSCRNLCEVALTDRSYQGCEFFAADLDNAAIGAGRDAASQQYSIVVSNPSAVPTDVWVERNVAPLGAPPQIEEIARVTVSGGDLEVFDLPRREVDGSSGFAPCEATSECGSPDQCYCAGGLLVTDPPPEGEEHRDCRCRNAPDADGLNDGTHSAVTSNAYRVRSVLPIIAYQFNPLDNVSVFSNDASLLLPVSALNTIYTAIGWPQTIANSTIPNEDFDPVRLDEDLRAFLTIVGASEGTHVTVTLGQQVRRVMGLNGYPNGVPGDVWEFDIGPFDVVNLETGGFNADFTGTHIEASLPIAVFSGSEASDAPRFNIIANRQCCADHLEEQLVPNDTLGRRFFIGRQWPRTRALNAAFLDPTRDSVGEFNEPEYVRILATNGLTTITTTLPGDDAEILLEEGESVILTALQDFEMEADRPIAVLQVTASQEAVGIPTYYPGGDPDIIVVPPVEQYRRDYVFLTPSLYAFDFVTITAPRRAAILFDETPIDDFDCEVAPADGIERRMGDPPPEWVVYRCQLTYPEVLGMGMPVQDGDQSEDGYHTLRATEEIGLTVTGFDAFVSYGYSGGMNLDPIQ